MVVISNPRTSAAGNGEEAGYHANAWPAATIQPPAGMSCPLASTTCSWHLVPGEIPLTCTLSSSPHGRRRYFTVADMPVCGSLPVTVAAHGTADAYGRVAGAYSTRDPATAPPPTISTAAAATARRRQRRRLQIRAARSSIVWSRTSDGP